MEFSTVHQESIRIKSKQAVFVIDPQEKGVKTITDAVLLLKNSEVLGTTVSGQRVIVSGPGEYEVGGVKITGMNQNGMMYVLHVDEVEVFVTSASALEKTLEGNEYEIIVINADTVLRESFITTLSPKVVIIYGLQASEAAKALGRDSIPVAKYVISADKLPEEMEVIVLANS